LDRNSRYPPVLATGQGRPLLGRAVPSLSARASRLRLAGLPADKSDLLGSLRLRRARTRGSGAVRLDQEQYVTGSYLGILAHAERDRARGQVVRTSSQHHDPPRAACG
jgi:hypothetical protein